MINDYPEYEPDDDLAAGEQEFYETQRLIDECFIHTGSLKRRIDEMSELLETFPDVKGKRKYAETECPF